MAAVKMADRSFGLGFNRGMKILNTLMHLNPWFYLLLAGVFEIGFTSCMKLSNGFQNWSYNIGFAICAIASFGLLNISTRDISLGTAYAVWTGIGAFGTVLIGILFFKEPAGLWKLFFLTTLISSIIGVKFVSPS